MLCLKLRRIFSRCQTCKSSACTFNTDTASRLWLFYAITPPDSVCLSACLSVRTQIGNWNSCSRMQYYYCLIHFIHKPALHLAIKFLFSWSRLNDYLICVSYARKYIRKLCSALYWERFQKMLVIHTNSHSLRLAPPLNIFLKDKSVVITANWLNSSLQFNLSCIDSFCNSA